MKTVRLSISGVLAIFFLAFIVTCKKDINDKQANQTPGTVKSDPVNIGELHTELLNYFINNYSPALDEDSTYLVMSEYVVDNYTPDTMVQSDFFADYMNNYMPWSSKSYYFFSDTATFKERRIITQSLELLYDDNLIPYNVLLTARAFDSICLTYHNSDSAKYHLRLYYSNVSLGGVENVWVSMMNGMYDLLLADIDYWDANICNPNSPWFIEEYCTKWNWIGMLKFGADVAAYAVGVAACTAGGFTVAASSIVGGVFSACFSSIAFKPTDTTKN